MTVTYQREPLADAITDIKALLPEMWSEMAEGWTEERAEPRWELYFWAESKEAAFLLTAREDGKMVGYFGMLIAENPSLKGQLLAESTPYYVVRRRDRGLILRSLIRYAITVCQRAKVSKVLVKTHPWASAEPVLVHLGAREVEKRFMFDLVSGVREAVSA